MESDILFMTKALQEAQRAYEEDEVPIGCVIVQGGKIIARGRNQVEALKDPTAHAEIIAITAGCVTLGSKYLTDAVMYVTMEPCLMCAGAIYWSRIARLVFGCVDPKRGFTHSIHKTHPYFYKKMRVDFPLMEIECGAIVKDFFKKKR